MRNLEISPANQAWGREIRQKPAKKHRNLVIFDAFFAENLLAPHLAHPKIAKFEHWGREISRSRPGGGNAVWEPSLTKMKFKVSLKN
jgi:hypothetical protein